MGRIKLIENANGAIEAVLFACGDPMDSSKLCDIIEADENELDLVIKNMNQEYENRNSGIHIIKIGEKWQMATVKKYSQYIKTAMDLQKSAPLSNAAMEVLTIIAYNQPVSKSFVSSVRGVESGSLVNNLVDRELLEEAGRLDVPGKPIAYKTTDNFLRCFGLLSLDDLEPVPDTLSVNDIEDSQKG